MDEEPVGFPVLKHPVLLRLLVGHAGDPARIREMLEEYVAQLAARSPTCTPYADSLRGADAPGDRFHYPSVVADWGLDYFAAETRHTRAALDRLSEGSSMSRRTSGRPVAHLRHRPGRRPRR